jgi:hypothetical protein
MEFDIYARIKPQKDYDLAQNVVNSTDMDIENSNSIACSNRSGSMASESISSSDCQGNQHLKFCNYLMRSDDKYY